MTNVSFKPAQADQRRTQMTYAPCLVMVLLVVSLFTNCVLIASTFAAGRLSAAPKKVLDNARTEHSKCAYPIVYNRPHKTGSTAVNSSLIAWAIANGRPTYLCARSYFKITMSIRDCIPVDRSGCAVVSAHLELDTRTRQLLEDRIGKFVTLTSTRNAEDRILSYYMQKNLINSEQAQKDVPALRAHLKQMNPWHLYNFHTGEGRTGKCPLNNSERRRLVNMVKHYDVVIDMDFPVQSNKILAWKGMCQLAEKRFNVRGTGGLKLDDQTRRVLKEVSCVEEEMHRLFHMRIGSLYERATGEPCLADRRKIKTCF